MGKTERIEGAEERVKEGKKGAERRNEGRRGAARFVTATCGGRLRRADGLVGVSTGKTDVLGRFRAAVYYSVCRGS